MSFHVEISSGLRHARVFNLDEAELHGIVDRWVTDRRIELGDREWQPRQSALKILEGPALDNPDLSFGQGWANAERSAQNVTRSVIENAESLARASAPVAIVVEADSATQAVAEMVAGQEAQQVAWPALRDRIDGRDPEIAAVILVIERSAPEPRSEP